MTDASSLPKIEIGSQPYEDGSGYRYEIQVRAREDGAAICIGYDSSCFFSTPDEWERLKADVDKAIAAFRVLEKRS